MRFSLSHPLIKYLATGVAAILLIIITVTPLMTAIVEGWILLAALSNEARVVAATGRTLETTASGAATLGAALGVLATTFATPSSSQHCSA